MIPSHIKIGDFISPLNEYIIKNNYSKIAFLADNNSYKYCLKPNEKSFSFEYNIIKIKEGEANKILQSCEKVWKKLIQLKFDRHSLIINLGGGVICDLGGFVASTYMRGIDFINIPSTLLSQVDASIGGKVGIDYYNLKNLIGVFNEPKEVLVDINLLKTLSKRELKSGFAEIIKHCLIRDKDMFFKISKTKWDSNSWKELVKHSISIKYDIVKNDPTEQGMRKILNFGHTIGHAIETTYLSKSKKFLHGEAISIGIICEAFISNYFNKLSHSDLNIITKYLLSIYPLPKLNFKKEIINNTLLDKKNKSNKIRTCILSGIGSCEYNFEIDKDLISNSIDFYNKNTNEKN